MARDKTVFVCGECGGQSAKWQGRCPHCGAWNSLVETVPTAAPRAGVRTGAHAALAPTAQVQVLRDVHASALPHLPSGIDELDRVLGGGLVPASVVLIGGDPGIGKSTLLLQVLAALSRTPRVPLERHPPPEGVEASLGRPGGRLASAPGAHASQTGVPVLYVTG